MIGDHSAHEKSGSRRRSDISDAYLQDVMPERHSDDSGPRINSHVCGTEMRGQNL